MCNFLRVFSNGTIVAVDDEVCVLFVQRNPFLIQLFDSLVLCAAYAAGRKVAQPFFDMLAGE